MFDRFMEQTLPYWLMATALLPLVIAFFLIKAALRIRQLRSLLDDATKRAAQQAPLVEAHPWQTTDSSDWAAQR